MLRRRKVAKHLATSISEDSFSYARHEDSIAAEAALDGIYVLRTTVTDGDLGSGEIVASYKSLAHVGSGLALPFPSPTAHERGRAWIRAHVFCGSCCTTPPGTCTTASRPSSCLAARRRSRPRPPGAALSLLLPAPRGPGQGRCKRTQAGPPVHSFDSLLADLATICLNQIQPAGLALPGFSLVTTPTPLQHQALDLLGVSHRLGLGSQHPHQQHPETPGKQPCTPITGELPG